MPLPTIDFVGMTPSPALRAEIERHALRLSHLAPRMTSCHVTLRRAEGHHRHGSRFRARIRVLIPGAAFDVGAAGSAHDRDDAYAAVRDTFHVVRDKIEEFQAMRRPRRDTHHSQDAA